MRCRAWCCLLSVGLKHRYLKHYFWSIVTLEHGPMGSISALFTLSLVWRMLLKPFLAFFYKGTVFQSVVSVPTAIIFAPLPTLFRFFATPFMRWDVFVRKELLPFLRKTGALEDELAEDEAEEGSAGGGADGEAGDPSKQLQEKKKEKVERDLDKMKEAAAGGGGGGGGVDAQLRKRKAKKVSKADIEAEKERVLLGKGVGGTKLGANEEAADEADEQAAEGAEEGDPAGAALTVANKKSLRELIERRPPRLTRDEEQRLAMNTGGRGLPRSKAQWRQVGSSTIKFEFVLTLTKNIVPLLMMIVMGQVSRTTPLLDKTINWDDQSPINYQLSE